MGASSQPPLCSPTSVQGFRAPSAVSPWPEDGGGVALYSGVGGWGGAGCCRGVGHGGLYPCNGLGQGPLSWGEWGTPLLLPLWCSCAPHRTLCRGMSRGGIDELAPQQEGAPRPLHS